MEKKTYDIFLDGSKIGISELEKADASMGVVFGKLNFTSITFGYEFIKAYCINNSIEIVNEEPDVQLISTSNIKGLKVINSNGIEIKGLAVSIEGMDSTGFELNIVGISYPFFADEFPEHI